MMAPFGWELIEQGDLMDEVCSQIMSMLEKNLETHWPTLFNQPFAELISGSKQQPHTVEILQTQWWERIQAHVSTWCKRQADSLTRRLSQRISAGQTARELITDVDLTATQEKIRRAVRQLVLVQTLIDGELTPDHEKRIREELWLELAPQVERTAQCYAKSAARRGFEVEDLIQDASAHFQQVITRFNPKDPRLAMLGTWFDDVVDNLFAAAVRPRKSDSLKRGIGGGTEEQISDEVPTSPKQSLRYVRDFRRQREVEESLRHLDEVCSQLVETGVCPLERVLAFKLYACEGLTYQEVAEALKSQGYHYGTTQMFNFVKEVKAHIQSRFEGDPFGS
jgi:RNA polymerase sigma factor (sigma-70 family)